ncbi:MAG: hypothetical protein MdMp014T_1198 [Treponematales bacterium]
MKNLFEHETAGNGPAITGGGAPASPAVRTPRRTGGGMKTALLRALRLACILASLAPLVGCELGFGSVLHKPPSGGDDDGGNGGEPGQRYSITYYLNGGTFGSAAAPSAYTPGSLPLTLPQATRTGYEFKGWYENGDLTGSPVISIPKDSTGDKTFWAKWEEISYTITLHLNGGDLPSGSGWSKNGSDAAGFIYTKTYTISSGDITLPQAEYPPHSFDGWFDITLAGTKTTAVPTGSTGNKVFYARYPYTVTFDSDGGSEVAGITALGADAKITEPAPPVKGGYDFGGWYKEPAKTNRWDFGADTVNADMTLYAKWELATYDITYSENGGSDVADDTYTINSPDIPLPPITRTGYQFMGWYDNKNLTGSPVTTIPAGSWGNKQFWAKWEEISYTITLHLNGGGLPSGSGWSGPKAGSAASDYVYTKTYTINSPAITLPDPVPAAGYSFIGWFTDEACATSAGSPPEVPKDSTGDKEFWAKWEEIPYTITLHLNGGDLPSGSGWSGPKAGSAASDYVYTKTYTVSSPAITLPEPVSLVTGYGFGGWFTNAACAASAGTPPVVVPTGSTGVKTFWAKWEEISYTITLHLNGGGLPSGSGWSGPKAGSAASDYVYTKTYTINSPAVTLPEPERAGCTFLGWFTDEAFTVSAGTPPEVPAGSTGDKEFWAKWFVPVTDITGVPTTMGEGTSITLSGTVSPPDATNRTIVWSVVNAGGTGATITNNGNTYTLSATTAGTVTVRATIANGTAPGTAFTKDFTITVAPPWFYRGTPDTGVPIDLSSRTETTRIDRARAWLAASGEADTLYTLVLDSGFSQTPVALSGLAASGITLVVTTRDDTEREVTLSANGSLFTVGAAVTLRLDRSVTLRGKSGNNSPLVQVNAAGTLEATGNAKITGNYNSSYNYGGGVVVSGGTFTLSGSASVSGNSTSSYGGGVYVYSGAFTMSGGSVSGNTARLNGGGIENNGTFLMSGGEVSNNTASSGAGGGIHANSGTSTLSGSASVWGNTASIGGGVNVSEGYSGGTFAISGSASVWGNTANNGGGVYVDTDGRFTMNDNASVSGNTAAYYGGGVYNRGTFTLNGGRIQGGADSDGFTENTASSGAALYNGGTAKFGAASTGCAVGTASKNAGDDIVSASYSGTDDTIVATGP